MDDPEDNAPEEDDDDNYSDDDFEVNVDQTVDMKPSNKVSHNLGIIQENTNESRDQDISAIND